MLSVPLYERSLAYIEGMKAKGSQTHTLDFKKAYFSGLRIQSHLTARTAKGENCLKGMIVVVSIAFLKTVCPYKKKMSKETCVVSQRAF